MLQLIRSCKLTRPWFHESGFKVLSTKSEALWASCCWSVNSCLISSKHVIRLALQQQPLPWARCCPLTCRGLNLQWVHGPIWQKCDHVPEPKLGQRSTLGAEQCTDPALLSTKPWPWVLRQATSNNLASLPLLICKGRFNNGMPAKPMEEVPTQQFWFCSWNAAFCLHCADAAVGKIALITKWKTQG